MGMEGILKRRVSILRGYQDRWFILSEDGIMKQHEKKPSYATEKAKWQMNIILADIDKKRDGKCFNLTSNQGQKIKLKAQSDDEREKWIKCFKKINHIFFPHSFPDVVDEDDEDDVFTSNSNHKAKEVDPKPKPTSRISFGDTFKSKDAFPSQNNDHRKSEETVNEPPRESAAEITKKFKEMTIVDRKKRHLMVAAIDFGSAYSGSAFSFKDRFIKDPLEINVMGIGQKGLESLKVPTVLLLNPDREFVAFGFEAESKYSELLQDDPDEAQKWYYFSRFKMQLYNNMHLKKSMTIKDITGKKEMKAVDVFAYCIENIKDSIFGKAKEKVTELQENDVHWVLTVPAIWNEAARQFMLEAAEKAGIDQEMLTLALEPEAAALCCKCLEIQKRTTGKGSKLGSFDTGARFLVVDLGGGTVDITSNEVLASGQLKEIHSASGGPWGGNTINEGIWKLLQGVFGENTVTRFIAENRDDYLELARTVELKKRTVTSDNKVTIEIPRSLLIEAKNRNPGIIAEEFKDRVKLVTNKLQVLPGVLPQIFKEGIDTVSKYVQDLLDQPETKGVSTILLVGGYAACDLLKDAMKTKFSNLTVICPLDPDVVVLKGAVIMGHMETPIVGRIAKCHYGIAILVGVDKQNMYQCFDRSFKPLTSTEEEFYTIIKKGQPIQVNEVVTEYDFPITFEQDEAFIRIYASDDTQPPKIISKNNCREIGHIRIKLPKFRRETRLKIGISNSETEFKVVARDEHTVIFVAIYCEVGMEGILKRKISIFRGYQDRWFLLTKDGIMRQYEKQPSNATQKAKWEMHVMLADIDQKKDGLRFNLTSNNGQNIKLKAQSEDEREKWIECLKKWNSNDAEDDEDVFSSDSNQEVRYDEPEPSKGTRKRMESDADILEKFKEITILKKKKDYTMVAAIDFGSAYSGCAFSTTNSFIKNPLEILNMGLDQKGNESLKVPTVLLLNPDRKFVAFGHRAEDQYTDLLEKTPDEAHKWYYFSRFKMQLYNNMTLKKSMTIKDITGKNELKAVDVFAFCIEYIWNTLFRRAKEQITNLNEENIHWVITVPAIWSEDARQFMIEAAKKAGIDEERLTLALEPEAAAFYCKSDEIQRRASKAVGGFGSFDTGARFLVVDLGGGTVDITSNEILESGQLKEIHSASGGPWGGNTINTRIWKLLRGIFGDKVVTKFIAEHRVDYLDLARNVELKKRVVTSDGKMRLEIPRSLIIGAKNSNSDTIAEEYKEKVKLIKNMLIFSPEVVLQIFKEGIEKIIRYVQDLLDQLEVKGVSTILLVGGYASCDILKDAMKTKFNKLTVICPLDPDFAVLKGAVIMGHMDTPIVGRIAKFHYGIAQSKPLTPTVEEFHTIIRKGHPIQVNEIVTGYDFPITFNKEEALIQIYASDNEEPPQIISPDNCRKIGQIRIKFPKFRKEARLKIGISSSETELKVVARDEHTGKCFEGVCSFLN